MKKFNVGKFESQRLGSFDKYTNPAKVSKKENKFAKLFEKPPLTDGDLAKKLKRENKQVVEEYQKIAKKYGKVGVVSLLIAAKVLSSVSVAEAMPEANNKTWNPDDPMTWGNSFHKDFLKNVVREKDASFVPFKETAIVESKYAEKVYFDGSELVSENLRVIDWLNRMDQQVRDKAISAMIAKINGDSKYPKSRPWTCMNGDRFEENRTEAGDFRAVDIASDNDPFIAAYSNDIKEILQNDKYVLYNCPAQSNIMFRGTLYGARGYKSYQQMNISSEMPTSQSSVNEYQDGTPNETYPAKVYFLEDAENGFVIMWMVFDKSCCNHAYLVAKYKEEVDKPNLDENSIIINVCNEVNNKIENTIKQAQQQTKPIERVVDWSEDILSGVSGGIESLGTESLYVTKHKWMVPIYVQGDNKIDLNSYISNIIGITCDTGGQLCDPVENDIFDLPGGGSHDEIYQPVTPGEGGTINATPDNNDGPPDFNM